jgi:hypothetical protein
MVFLPRSYSGIVQKVALVTRLKSQNAGAGSGTGGTGDGSGVGSGSGGSGSGAGTGLGRTSGPPAFETSRVGMGPSSGARLTHFLFPGRHPVKEAIC